MWKSVLPGLKRMTSLVILLFSISTLFLFEVGQSTFCPVTSPNDEVVYVTDTPTKLMIGATKTGCAVDCLHSNCRCINYNVTSLNCSVFNFEPKNYAVDKSNNTVAYEVIANPLTGLWSTVPVTNCSFPFVYQGLNYCGCRRGVMFPNDKICSKSYYSCQLKNGGKPAFCDGTMNSQVVKIGCSLDSACNGTSVDFPCTCNAGFTGDGFTCTDINECLANNGGCSRNSFCYNFVGSFLCSCPVGYAENGVSCSDINECENNNGGCNKNTTCINFPGRYGCSCQNGYPGNRVPCAEGCVLSNPVSLVGANGTIVSLNFPQVYPNNANCQWLITASASYKVVKLSFEAFCTEQRYDFVNVYDGSNENTTQLMSNSGCSKIPGPIASSQRYMYIHFYSDKSLVFSGFNATYNTL